MSLKKTLTAVRFAHLLGIRASQAEDDEMKQGADESDEDYAKRMEEDEKKKEDEAKRAQEDEKKKEDEAKKAEDEKNKSKAGGGNDEEDEKEKAARKSERARCAAIFASPAAGIRPDVAAHLAFSTDMSSADAVGMLETVSAGSTPVRGLAMRMATVAVPNVGDSGGAAPAAGSSTDIAAKIVAAGKKRRGES